MPNPYDKLDRPTPGSSLTKELGTGPGERPPTITNPDDLLNTALEKLDNPEKMDSLMDLVLAGTPIETIVNTWAKLAFQENQSTPDAIELVKPSLALVLMDQAMNRQIEPIKMFNDDIASKEKKRTAQVLNVMKEGNPDEYERLKELSADAPEAVEDVEDSGEGLIPQRKVT